MVTLKAAAVAAAAALIAVAMVLLLAHGGSPGSASPPAPLTAHTSFDRSAAQFGDALTARVVVALDRKAVKPDTLRVLRDLAPFTVLSPPSRTRTVSGDLETVSITQRVACLTAQCLAPRIALPPVHVSVAGRDGNAVTATAAWRRLALGGRVVQADLAASSPRFAADTAPDAATYRLSPSSAAAILEVVAALAAAGAVALLAWELILLRRRRRPAVSGDELDRALRLVREAEARPVPDRRRALALLARLLRSRDGALGSTASDLAWSKPAPEPQALDSLAADVERGVGR
jgi:hypothetical protein